MSRVTVSITGSKECAYDIYIAPGLLMQPQKWLPKDLKPEKVVIVTDHKVKKIYAQKLMAALKKMKMDTLLLSFPAGEKSKSIQTKQYIEESMLRARCGRNTLILALGGGVVGDLAGFTAATYMRGIPYIQLPTTLLAMVDSSVGGKTGIDNSYGKNLIGAFWQPSAVVADSAVLASLSLKHHINGLIEALKVFLTSDKKSFLYALNHLDAIVSGTASTLEPIIHKAVRIKADVVRQDEKEANLRMILNFGHTMGHAIEHVTNYKMLHGFAVAYGILIEIQIAYLLGLLAEKDLNVIIQLFKTLGINANPLKKLNIDKLILATKSDKKAKSGEVRYVLLTGIGKVHIANHRFAHPVPDKLVKQAFLRAIEV